jgi:hypothetical protein
VVLGARGGIVVVRMNGRGKSIGKVEVRRRRKDSRHDM